MHIVHRTLRGASACALGAALGVALSLGSVAGSTAGAASPSPQLPQVGAAKAAAQWLAGQLTPSGYIVTPGSSPATPDLSATVNAILALEAANVDISGAKGALSYLEQNASSYYVVDGASGPGQLGLLILAAHALGVDPTNFGGANLVTLLLATEQTSGPDAGMYGTEQQLADEFVGTYDQGLALAGLKAAGVVADAAAVTWLVAQQCADGGWTFGNQATNACDQDPSAGGPDTNTTSLAVDGLAAQGALGATVSAAALSFFKSTQDSDGGWGYSPNASDDPETTDPDSTSLVIQALLAMGQAPGSAAFATSGGTPISALLSFRVTSGTDVGALYSIFGSPTAGDLFATYQGVPALMGLSFPYGPSGHSYWEVNAGGGVFSFGDAAFWGSTGNLKLNKPIVGMAATPDGGGYWLVASDGGVFSFGDAAFHGSTGGMALNKPIVGIAATPDGGGYWLVASDGGVFAYGDAGYFGSTGGMALNKPIVGIAAAPDGGGYWLVASDGGVFAYGDAAFHGSTGGMALNKPIVGIAATPDGGGYWLVASDGGVFSYGDAGYLGSTGNIALNKPIVGVAATPDGGGYWLFASDGGVFNFGDAAFSGSATPFGTSTVVGGSVSAS